MTNRHGAGRAPLSISLLGALALLVAPAAAQDELPEDLDGLVALLRDGGDEAPMQAYYDLAGLGTEAAFEALAALVEDGANRTVRRRVFVSLRAWPEGDALEPRVRRYLFDRVVKADDEDLRDDALNGLAGFGERALAELETLARSDLPEELRGEALDAVIEPLCARNDPDALELVLELAKPDAIGWLRGDLPDALLAVHDERCLTILAREFEASAGDPAWRILMFDALVDEEATVAVDLLYDLLDGKDATYRERAILALGARGEEKAERKIDRALRAKEPNVVRAAVVALQDLRGGDSRWFLELKALARDKREAARLGAAAALGEQGTVDALELLVGLLPDDSWRVRVEAVQQLARARQAEHVPLFIERLEDDAPRVVAEAALALRLLTGEDHGAESTRWAAWWADHGEGFVPVDPDAAVAAERERRERRVRTDTVGSFFGLPVRSERAAFLVDVSSSMGDDMLRADDSLRVGALTQLGMAKRELEDLIGASRVGTHFNVIFFRHDVIAWRPSSVELTERLADDALAFVRAEEATSSTNLFDALELALSDEELDAVYVLSDGVPSAGRVQDPDAIRAEVSRVNALRKVAVHAVSLGSDNDLMRGLAEDSGGDYRFFR